MCVFAQVYRVGVWQAVSVADENTPLGLTRNKLVAVDVVAVRWKRSGGLVKLDMVIERVRKKIENAEVRRTGLEPAIKFSLDDST